MPQHIATDARAQQLAHWVAVTLGAPGSQIQLQPIASDAGFRRYFRFSQPSEWLAVDAPPATEDTRQFVHLAGFLGQHQVRTPRILAADSAAGWLLVEDFGNQLLCTQLSNSAADSALQLYQQAFASLLKLQACPDQPELLPRYDRSLLRRELQIFSDWFVSALLGYPLNDAEQAMLDALFAKLEQAALEQPQTLVHRDFHSRNLVLCSDHSLGVIDFQGALWGGCTYDLVSLLRDCYFHLPESQVSALVLDYRQQAQAAGLLATDIDELTYLRWFDCMGLQRHIKVLGIFARLHLRDHKPQYLHDLPLVIRYSLEVAGRYPGLTDFAHWFSSQLLPIIERQHWYSDYRLAGARP